MSKLRILIFVSLALFQLLFAQNIFAESVSLSSNAILKGGTVTVYWTGFSGLVNVKLYTGSTFVYANTQGESSGQQDLVMTDYPVRNDYKVVVELKSNTDIYSESNYFSVNDPNVTVSPLSIAQGGTVTANWFGFASNVNVMLYNGSTFLDYATTTGNGAGKQDLVMTGYDISTSYRVKVELKENTGIYKWSNDFSIYKPSITVGYPNGGETLTKGQNYNITWTSTNVSGNIKVEVYKNGQMFKQLAADDPNDGSCPFTPNDIFEAGSDYQIAISAVNNSAYDFSNSNFTILNIAPSLTVNSLVYYTVNNEQLLYNVVQPNPLTVKIVAEATGGHDFVRDELTITLSGTYTNYYQNIKLTETSVDSNIYTAIFTLFIENNTNKGTVAVSQTKDFGDGQKLIDLSDDIRGKASGYGFQSNFNATESYPACTPSSIMAAGYEIIRLTNINYASNSFPGLFIKNQAEIFMYSGDGFSDSYNTPGAIDMGDEDYIEYTFRCSPNDISDNDWDQLKTVIFACCSVFDGNKDYGKAWFQKNGPQYFLGYRGSAPNTEDLNSDSANIITNWHQYVVDDNLNEAEAWMKANEDASAWYASAYDKENKKYWYFFYIPKIYHKLCSKILDVESELPASGGVVYQPENLTLDIISENQINISWDKGLNLSEWDLEYVVLRAKTNNINNAEFYVTTTETSFQDLELTPGTTYYYWVGAYIADTEPIFSNLVYGTTEGQSSILPVQEFEHVKIINIMLN